MLAHDVVLHGDGGGKAPAVKRAIHGRAKVARTLMAGLRATIRFGGITIRREQVNGQPGALAFDREGRLLSVMSLDVAEGQIQGVSAIVNPDKLRHLGPVGDLWALLRERS
jgi:RNA polymerase sigma-70 factor (ECF subfamily)